MPVPLVAVAAFYITTAACSEKKKIRGDRFIGHGEGCGFFVQDHSQQFRVGEVGMSQFIRSNMESLPSVRSVSVTEKNQRVQVDVTVDEFKWDRLEAIYQRELELSDIFKDQSIDFRVIDGSPNAREAALLG